MNFSRLFLTIPGSSICYVNSLTNKITNSEGWKGVILPKLKHKVLQSKMNKQTNKQTNNE